jgi:FtsP/CotA-like multicopper oxidase with cupredoxin domain
MLNPQSAVLLAGLLALAGSYEPARLPANPKVEANDNRVSAGTRIGDTLVIRLVAQRADWYPDSDPGPFITVEAFGEEGKAPQVPAPLIRVPTGTTVRATIRNALPDSTIHVIGFAPQPIAASETLHVAPGATTEVVFRAGTPGTYLYRAVIGHDPDARSSEKETAGGAFVVDPLGGSPPDRILVMNIYSEQIDSVTGREALAINGKSWPHTERIGLTVGDTARWRVINGTARSHPMHLHGFYFRLDQAGDGITSQDIPDSLRALGVTENMSRWHTRTLTWSPDRPGNWLFHCHLTFHVIPDARLDHAHDADVEIRETTSHNPMEHMAGLVLGMTVAPRPGESYAQPGTPRRVDLFVNEGGPRGAMQKTFSYIMQRGPVPPAPDSVEIPGSLLVLTRGEPTDVVVHNRAREAVAVHWHGIELESFSDGVAGWSGAGAAVAPPVLPGDNFTARLDLVRAGTFMYHTHINDIEQVVQGAIGPLVVLEPGERFDASRDHVYIGHWNAGNGLMVNGDSAGGPPLDLAANLTHRFRMINIGPANNIRYRILQDTTHTQWRARAKDGADLPPARRTIRVATQLVAVGETFDFEFTPPTPGTYELQASFGNRPASWRQRLVFK